MTIITMKMNTTLPAAIVTGSQMLFQGLSAKKKNRYLIFFFFTIARLPRIFCLVPHLSVDHIHILGIELELACIGG